ncbi:hypothetical protein D3C71_84720 [compost metagenome]
MKKLFLVAVTALGVTTVNAGVCALGSTKISDNGNGTSTVSCPYSGSTCFETDKNDLKDLKSGDVILVHYNGGTFEAVVASATIDNSNSKLVSGVNYTFDGEISVFLED